VETSIDELLSLGCISEVSAEPEIVNPLSVSISKSGKKRLILDLRHINKCFFKNKFRSEDISIVKEILNPGDFMFSFDLNLVITTLGSTDQRAQVLVFCRLMCNGGKMNIC